ncbi:hypothetical protein YC2023_111928 [Brassica napus]
MVSSIYRGGSKSIVSTRQYLSLYVALTTKQPTYRPMSRPLRMNNQLFSFLITIFGINAFQHVRQKEKPTLVELIGPYWSIRAALGPVLETLILLGT